jgi:hypothetical protein
MRRTQLNEAGQPVCRRCGSEALLAKSSQHGRRWKTLKCANCGERQHFWKPKSVRSNSGS